MPKKNLLAAWLKQVDIYEDAASSTSQLDILLPPHSPEREKLLKGAVSGQIDARTKFLTYLHNHVLQAPISQSTKVPNTIALHELLGTNGMKLYLEAIEEERNSYHYRKKVFESATEHHPGARWKNKMVLWVGGPSASGKSFGAKAIIHSVKDQMETVPENNEGNYVVSIDGGIEREISQMRQMVLQVALSKGHVGIEDLHKHTSLGIKKLVQAAAEESKSLSLVIPDTFANPITFLKKEHKISTFEKDEQVTQFFSQVVGKPGDPQKFKHSVYQSGNTRAWYDKQASGEFTQSMIKMNNTNIGCESKAYDDGPFEAGKNMSEKAMAHFKSVSKSDLKRCIILTNDLIHIYQEPNTKEWKICPKDKTPTHKMTERDFNDFTFYLKKPKQWSKESLSHKIVANILKDKNPITPDLWLQCCRQHNIASKPLITTLHTIQQKQKRNTLKTEQITALVKNARSKNNYYNKKNVTFGLFKVHAEKYLHRLSKNLPTPLNQQLKKHMNRTPLPKKHNRKSK